MCVCVCARARARARERERGRERDRDRDRDRETETETETERQTERKRIPANQAGFMKGRSFSKVTSLQLSQRKSTLATFLDVKKDYGSVWNASPFFLN